MVAAAGSTLPDGLCVSAHACAEQDIRTYLLRLESPLSLPQLAAQCAAHRFGSQLQHSRLTRLQLDIPFFHHTNDTCCSTAPMKVSYRNPFFFCTARIPSCCREAGETFTEVLHTPIDTKIRVFSKLPSCYSIKLIWKRSPSSRSNHDKTMLRQHACRPAGVQNLRRLGNRGQDARNTPLQVVAAFCSSGQHFKHRRFCIRRCLSFTVMPSLASIAGGAADIFSSRPLAASFCWAPRDADAWWPLRATIAHEEGVPF